MNIKTIIRKTRPMLIRTIKVRDLDKSKCSTKFLSHNFDSNTEVNVKCFQDGSLDLRGNKQEYRIIVSDTQNNE